jgi:hypothetical protein
MLQTYHTKQKRHVLHISYTIKETPTLSTCHKTKEASLTPTLTT